jgi:4-hydroxybutyrate CoA-transferase
MERWRDEFERKMISAEEAANLVKSGDRVAFTMGREAYAVGMALAVRKEELRDVKVYIHAPGYDLGWYDKGWRESFDITIGQPTALVQDAVYEHDVDVLIHGLIPAGYPGLRGEADVPDVLITEVSAPDDLGFCSFGNSLWDKKKQIQKSKLTIAEVNSHLIRTFGENYIHVSEIDYFVPHVSTEGIPGKRGSLTGREFKEPPPYVKKIADHVSDLIRDGDTLQIGVGRTTEPLVGLGMLDKKCDLGWHSEATPPGIISLIRTGKINGSRKTINRGKAVVTSIGGSSQDEMEWVNRNPLIWLMEVEYLEDIRVIAAHDHFVSINSALMVDLVGQIACETIGSKRYSMSGGQLPFACGAWLSKGGRYIVALPSTAEGRSGPISRIVPTFPLGTVSSIPAVLADYIVSEYGVARLAEKSLRQRADALISIAHPDFRSDLRKAALE